MNKIRKIPFIYSYRYLRLCRKKSSDHYLDRSTYTGQKCPKLLRFTALVLPDRYKIDTIGPFQKIVYDATIAQQLVEIRNELMQ